MGSTLVELIELGNILLRDGSQLVGDLASAVTVDQIIRQFEILLDDVRDPSLFPGLVWRSKPWLKLATDLEDVKIMFETLNSNFDVYTGRYGVDHLSTLVAYRYLGSFADRLNQHMDTRCPLV